MIFFGLVKQREVKSLAKERISSVFKIGYFPHRNLGNVLRKRDFAVQACSRIHTVWRIICLCQFSNKSLRIMIYFFKTCNIILIILKKIQASS